MQYGGSGFRVDESLLAVYLSYQLSIDYFEVLLLHIVFTHNLKLHRFEK
jgi:hypothetical protein